VKRILSTLFAAVFAVVIFGGAAQAQTTQAINFNTKQPVEIPGRVLQPGHYVVRVESGTDGPAIVEVYKANHTNAYGLYQVRMTDRMDPGPTKVVTAAVDGVNRIEGFYFGGDTMGVKFLYPERNNHNMEVASSATNSSSAHGD